MTTILLVLMLGCRSGDADPTDIEPTSDTDAVDSDTEDTTSDTEGPSDPVEELLSNLEGCEYPEGDGSLDLVNGCLDGVCFGDDLDACEAAWGEADCSPVRVDFDGYSYAYYSCEFPNGASTSFDDDEEDGLDGSETFTDFSLSLDNEALTTEGAGINTEFACFIDALGEPTDLDIGQQDGEWLVDGMNWSDHSLYIDDWYDNKDGSYGEPDGLVDRLTLYGW